MSLALILVLFGITEIVLNLMIRSSLRSNFGAGPEQNGPVRLEMKVAWMSLIDLCRGRFGPLLISGENTLLKGLRLQKMSLINHGFTFDPYQLLLGKGLRFRTINQTRITVVISEDSLGEYFGLKYPDFEPGVIINPGEIVFSGKANLFGKKLPLTLSGVLLASAPKTLRFYPEKMLVSGKMLPPDLIKFVGGQLLLEFSLLENWPLKIRKITLDNHQLCLTFHDYQP